MLSHLRHCKGRCGPASRHRVQALHARASDLSERESDPGQPVELLAEWGTRLWSAGPLLAAQHDDTAAAGGVGRADRKPGQSIAYYVAVAAALGYTITITEFRQFRVSRSQVGDPVCGDPRRSTWPVNAEL